MILCLCAAFRKSSAVLFNMAFRCGLLEACKLREEQVDANASVGEGLTLRLFQHDAESLDGIEIYFSRGVLFKVEHCHVRAGDRTAPVLESHRAKGAVALDEGDAAGAAVGEKASECLAACHRFGAGWCVFVLSLYTHTVYSSSVHRVSSCILYTATGYRLAQFTYYKKNADVMTIPSTWTPERIRALRKRLGLRQEEMAERLGYSRQQTISELEKGLYPPGPQACIILDLLDKHGLSDE